MQTFREFAIHKFFELIGTAYRASFPKTNCTADRNQLTQFSATGFGKDISTYLVSDIFSTKEDNYNCRVKQHNEEMNQHTYIWTGKETLLISVLLFVHLIVLTMFVASVFFSPASQPSLTSLVSDEFLDASVEANEKEVGGR